MPQDSAPDTGYRYDNADLGHAHDYLLPSVLRVLDELEMSPSRGPGGGGGAACSSWAAAMAAWHGC